MRRKFPLLVVRWLAGGVFVAFGVGKFLNHASEFSSFKAYGLPAPGAFVVSIGMIELTGGLLLIAGILTRPAALVLAGDMVGAIVVSGIARGELISLTIAPAQLILVLVVLWSGSDPPGLSGITVRHSWRHRRAASEPDALGSRSREGRLTWPVRRNARRSDRTNEERSQPRSP